MFQQYIESSIRTILETWIILIQLDKEKTTNEVLLVDSIYSLFTCICQLLHLDGNYILDTWEQHNYSIDKTIEYIIAQNYKVIEANVDI